MTRKIFVAVLLTSGLVACDNPREKAIEKINQDEAILKRVSAAVNEVIRDSSDCDAAKAAIPEAYQRIDEARHQVSAPATNSTLDALKVQVDRVASACP
jgi:pyridoxal/pyridoxine/pyridoxamine kinase